MAFERVHDDNRRKTPLPLAKRCKYDLTSIRKYTYLIDNSMSNLIILLHIGTVKVCWAHNPLWKFEHTE